MIQEQPAMTATERAGQWALLPNFDAETRAEAARIATDPVECAASFGREMSFGTGGLRGVLGTGTYRMNRYTVARASVGLAAWLLQRGGGWCALRMIPGTARGSLRWLLPACSRALG